MKERTWGPISMLLLDGYQIQGKGIFYFSHSKDGSTLLPYYFSLEYPQRRTLGKVIGLEYFAKR